MVVDVNFQNALMDIVIPYYLAFWTVFSTHDAVQHLYFYEQDGKNETNIHYAPCNNDEQDREYSGSVCYVSVKCRALILTYY